MPPCLLQFLHHLVRSVFFAAIAVFVDGERPLTTELFLELFVVFVVLRHITEMLAHGALQAGDLAGSFFLFCHNFFLRRRYCTTNA